MIHGVAMKRKKKDEETKRTQGERCKRSAKHHVPINQIELKRDNVPINLIEPKREDIKKY